MLLFLIRNREQQCPRSTSHPTSIPAIFETITFGLGLGRSYPPCFRLCFKVAQILGVALLQVHCRSTSKILSDNSSPVLQIWGVGLH